MTWVEYHGRPWDAAMEDRPEAFDFIVVYRPSEPLSDGRHRVGRARSIYRREGRALQDLDVVRMQWHEGVPDDLRPMEGRILGRPSQPLDAE